MNVNLYSFKLLLFKFLANSRNGMFFNAKHSVRIFTLFSFSLVLASCEEGLFDPQPLSTCLETRQYDEDGRAIERIYDGKKITRLQVLSNNEVQYYYDFTYDNNGRIIKSQHVNALNGNESTPQIITYNDAGKWIKSTYTSSSGDVSTRSVEYNSEGQIQQITSSATRAGTTTVSYTVNYTWEGGNNTSLTFTLPQQKQVVQYEFDLDLENKRRKEQEKIAFLPFEILHNKNMYKRSTTTVTTTTPTGTTTSNTATQYSYELDEKGYPSRVTRIISGTGYTTPITRVTSFEFDCI